MKNKFKLCEIVRIKETGEKAKIIGMNNEKYNSFIPTVYYLKGKVNPFYEDQLKKFSPSRTGKYRDSKGRFIQGWMLRKPEDVAKDMSDSKQRNYQKKPIKEVSGFTGGINIKDFTPYVDNEQKILTTLERIEKKIDELGRRV